MASPTARRTIDVDAKPDREQGERHKAPRPLRADAERNRQRILRAAVDVFADRGLEVTMDEIARGAGVGVGTIYRRFPDKELLIDALFDERIGTVLELAVTARSHSDPWEGLVFFLEASTGLQAQDRGLKELTIGTSHGRDRVAHAREQLAPVVDELVRRAQEAGELRADIESTDMALIHVMLSAITDFTLPIAPDMWRRCLGLILDGLRAQRERASPLDHPAADDDQLATAMQAWRPSRSLPASG